LENNNIMEKDNNRDLILKLSPSVIAVISILFAAYSLWLNNKSNFELKKFEIYFLEKSKNYSELVSNITNYKIFLGYYSNPFNEKYFDSTATNKLLFFAGNINTKIYTLSPFLSKNIFDTLTEKVRILNKAAGLKFILMRIERTSNTEGGKKYQRSNLFKNFDKEDLNILNTLEGKETSINTYFNELLEFITKNVYSELFAEI